MIHSLYPWHYPMCVRLCFKTYNYSMTLYKQSFLKKWPSRVYIQYITLRVRSQSRSHWVILIALNWCTVYQLLVYFVKQTCQSLQNKNSYMNKIWNVIAWNEMDSNKWGQMEMHFSANGNVSNSKLVLYT